MGCMRRGAIWLVLLLATLLLVGRVDAAATERDRRPPAVAATAPSGRGMQAAWPALGPDCDEADVDRARPAVVYSSALLVLLLGVAAWIVASPLGRVVLAPLFGYLLLEHPFWVVAGFVPDGWGGWRAANLICGRPPESGALQFMLIALVGATTTAGWWWYRRSRIARRRARG